MQIAPFFVLCIASGPFMSLQHWTSEDLIKSFYNQNSEYKISVTKTVAGLLVYSLFTL